MDSIMTASPDASTQPNLNEIGMGRQLSFVRRAMLTGPSATIAHFGQRKSSQLPPRGNDVGCGHDHGSLIFDNPETSGGPACRHRQQVSRRLFAEGATVRSRSKQSTDGNGFRTPRKVC
jgi:hypothetical protein